MLIYRLFAVFILVLATPFLAVVGFFATCHGSCKIPNGIILTILGLAFAGPVIFAVAAVAALVVGAVGLRSGLRTARPYRAAIGAVILVLGVMFGMNVLKAWAFKSSWRPDPGRPTSVMKQLNDLKKRNDRKASVGDSRRSSGSPGYQSVNRPDKRQSRE